MRRPAPSTTRPAWAISLSVHGVGLASVLAFGAAHATHAAWSASASAPMVVAVRPDRPDVLEPPAEPAAVPEVDVVAEEPPREEAARSFEPDAAVDAARTPEPTLEATPERATAATLPLPRPASPRIEWLAAVRRVQPAETQCAVEATGASVEASPLHSENEPPDYPFVAFRRGVEGEVTVLLEIDENGAVTAAHVESSSGSSQLDDAALQKLATWRFEPARRGGRAVRGSWRQVVVFRIRS